MAKENLCDTCENLFRVLVEHEREFPINMIEDADSPKEELRTCLKLKNVNLKKSTAPEIDEALSSTEYKVIECNHYKHIS